MRGYVLQPELIALVCGMFTSSWGQAKIRVWIILQCIIQNNKKNMNFDLRCYTKPYLFLFCIVI